MKAAAFAYHRPDAVEEAVDLLAEYGDDAKILAGGQSLVPMLAMRLTHFENLVDISRIDELVGIDLCDGEVRIGAATPHAFVGMDDEVADSVPLLTLATPYIGHFQIRTRGTLGGAIAHADPAAEYAAVALALDAQMEAVSPRGTREIPANEFFTGLWENSMAPTRSSLPCASRCGARGRASPLKSSPAGTGISPSPAPLSRSSWMTIAREPLRHRASRPGIDSAARLPRRGGRPRPSRRRHHRRRDRPAGHQFTRRDPGRPAGVCRLSSQGRRHDGGPSLGISDRGGKQCMSGRCRCP